MTHPTNPYKHVLIHLGTAKQAACAMADYEVASAIREIIESLKPTCPECGQKLPEVEAK